MTPTPPDPLTDIRAAVHAKLSDAPLRGLVLLIASIGELLDPKTVPAPAYSVICRLCENLRSWVLVTNPNSPYGFLRGPVTGVDLALHTLDLRACPPDSERPEEVPRHVWPSVLRAAERYRSDRLAAIEPEGNA